MSDPWVKIKKRITEWEWYADPVVRGVFMHLILTCNYEPSTYQGHSIGVGQVVTGRKQLSLALGFSEDKIKRALKILRDTNEITIKATNKFSIVTVTNWALEQGKDKPKTQQEPQREPHPIPTSKESKNLINIFLLETGISEELWKDFLEERKRLKASNSGRALKLLMTEVRKLQATGNDPTTMVNESILRGWKSVYPTKKQNGGNHGNTTDSRRKSNSELADEALRKHLDDIRAEAGIGEQESGNSDDSPPELRHLPHLRQDGGAVRNNPESVQQDAGKLSGRENPHGF